MAKVKFIKSPTGNPFRLGYSIGQTADIKDMKLLQALVDAKMVEPEKAVKGKGQTATKPKGKTAAKNKPGETR